MGPEDFPQENIPQEPEKTQPPIEEEKNEMDELIERRDTLREEVFKGRLSGTAEQHIKLREALWDASDEELMPHFRGMVERIFHETPALKEVEDTIEKDNLLSGFREPEFPVAVHFEKEGEFNQEAKAQGKESTTEGDYNPVYERIRLRKGMPDHKDIWGMLTYGSLPAVMQTLDHELVHYWHYRAEREKTSLLEKFKRVLENKVFWGSVHLANNLGNTEKLLNESQSPMATEAAWIIRKSKMIADMVAAAVMQKTVEQDRKKRREMSVLTETLAWKASGTHNKSYTAQIIEHLAGAYGFHEPEDIDRIAIAAQAVDRFRALGLSDREIAGEFAGARYDPESATYPLIAKKLEKLTEEKSLSLEELDAKADIARIESEVHRYEAALIAQEELAKFAATREK